MHKLILLVAVTLSLSSHAQQLKMTDETTEIKFVARHLAGRLEGGFKGVQGTAFIDTANLKASYFKLSFRSGTVTTNENYLSPNLIKKDCFDPANFPTIDLSSTSITKLEAAGAYQFNGQLKVKGKTKRVSFPMTVKPNAGGFDFKFEFEMPKKAFGLQCGAVGKDFNIIVSSYGKRST